jgi:hypothetical protein
MSSKPRDAIREIVQIKPRVGFWALSSVYGIASGFFFAHFYSFGFSLSFPTIFVPLIGLGPLFGSLLLLFNAWLLRLVGYLFGGTAEYSHCLAAVTWSKVPYTITLLLWLFFLVQDPATVFLHVSSEGSALCIALVSIAVNFWSFLLLVQAFREIQSISLFKSLISTTLSSFFSFSFLYLLMFVSRFIYFFIF